MSTTYIIRKQLANVSQPLQSGLGIVSVTDFGADPTGASSSKAAVIAAAASLGTKGGIIHFPAGVFVVEGLPLRPGLYYQGAGIGQWLSETSGTILKLPASPSTHMFVWTTAATAQYGGGISDLACKGGQEGDLASSTYDCIDMSGNTDQQHHFTVDNIFIHGFRRGVSGSSDDRSTIFTRNNVWNCQVGYYIPNNHPQLPIWNDWRSCTYGLRGKIYDGTFNAQHFVGCDVGVGPIDTSNAVRQVKFIGCAFFQCKTTGAQVYSDCEFTGCLFTPAPASNPSGIIINGPDNLVTGCKFKQESTGSYTKGAIVFDCDTIGLTLMSNAVVGNHFSNLDYIFYHETTTTRDLVSFNLSNNTLHDCGGFYRRSGSTGAFFYGAMNNNVIRLDLNTLTAAVTGTSVTMTNGSTAVTGVGTTFTNLRVGDYIRLSADADTAWGKISVITSATSITLAAVYSGTGGTAAALSSKNAINMENSSNVPNSYVGNTIIASSASPQKLVYAIGGDLRYGTVVGNTIRRGNASGVDTTNSTNSTIASNGYLA